MLRATLLAVFLLPLGCRSTTLEASTLGEQNRAPRDGGPIVDLGPADDFGGPPHDGGCGGPVDIGGWPLDGGWWPVDIGGWPLDGGWAPSDLGATDLAH